MRTPVTLGLLALSISFFANTAVASSVEDCEPLKQSGNKSLYGLCVAWHHADDAAKDALAEKFADRAGYELADFLAPFSVPEPEPEPEQDFFCPCWSELSFEDICALGAPKTVTHFSGMATTVRFDGEVELTATVEEFSGQVLNNGCAHIIRPADGVGGVFLEDVMGGLSADDGLDCLAEADFIAVLHLDPICTGE